VFERTANRIRARFEPRFPHPHRLRHSFSMRTLEYLVTGFGIYSGIVPGGIDDLVTDDIDWAGDSTILLSYVKGRTATSIERRSARFAESTIAARLHAVVSRYDYHVLNGVDVGRDPHRITHRGGGRYKSLLEHIARRKGHRQAMIRVRRPRPAAAPIPTPQQIELISEACASWDTQARE
jgi:hypothetical protein